METFTLFDMNVGLDWRIVTFDELREVLDDDACRVPGHKLTNADITDFVEMIEADGLAEVRYALPPDTLNPTRDNIHHFEIRLIKEAWRLWAKEYAPDPYSPCPCGSGRKFKFCCYKTH
jgi:hypothetical protein